MDAGWHEGGPPHSRGTRLTGACGSVALSYAYGAAGTPDWQYGIQRAIQNVPQKIYSLLLLFLEIFLMEHGAEIHAKWRFSPKKLRLSRKKQ